MCYNVACDVAVVLSVKQNDEIAGEHIDEELFKRHNVAIRYNCRINSQRIKGHP